MAKNGATLQKYEYKYDQIGGGSVNTTKNTGQLAQVESWIGTDKQYRQQFEYDVLGRLTDLTETYGASLCSTAYHLKYRYDVFGNRFQKQADNAGNTTTTQKWVESGDIIAANNRYNSGVNYDANGNLTQNTDARGIQTNYFYDALNRVWRRQYVAPTPAPDNYFATPEVYYFYDDKGVSGTVADGKGLIR